MADTFDEVIAAERRLMEPAVRADRTAVESLLHPDFIEIGASGRVWSRGEIIDLMTADAAYAPPRTHGFEVSRIAPDTVLLTYATSGTRAARRSSIWQRVDGAWRVRFHQGTLTQGGPADPRESASG